MSAISFAPHVIVPGEGLGPISVYPADVDGDGDMDVVSAADTADIDVVLYRNIDGKGTFGPQEVITGRQMVPVPSLPSMSVSTPTTRIFNG